MYCIWYQLLHVRCLNFIESLSSVFEKLLRALTSFDLSSNVAFDMEWLILHMPLFARISGGYSLGVIQHLTWYKRFFLSSLFHFVFFCIYLWCLLFFFSFLSFRVLSFSFFLSLLFLLYIYFSFWLYFMFLFTPNGDIVRFRCGVGKLWKILKKIQKQFWKFEIQKDFCFIFGKLRTFWLV